MHCYVSSLFVPFISSLSALSLICMGLNANLQNGEYSPGGHICCENVNLRYDDEISGSQ